MNVVTHADLLAACTSGGASVLTSKTELRPAAGDLAGVAPARYVDGRQATYAYETRFDGQSAVRTVVLDSKGSTLNRIEEALSQALVDEDPVIAKMPHLTLTYEGMPALTDLDVPHRFTDGHFRAGTIDGTPATQHPAYRAMRDCTAANARPLLEGSPFSLIGGAWDATRRHNQVRFRSALVGEVNGILADQTPGGDVVPRRGAARWDSVAPSVRLSGEELEKVLTRQESELSPGNIDNIRTAISKAQKGTVSAAPLGLGSIPPSMDGLGFVSCSRIVRHHVLSFATLRQIRFGLGVEGDVAARALLAALALNGLARSDAELVLRANCDLVEAGPTKVELDGRQGRSTEHTALTIAQANALLEEAIVVASSFGVRWEGQTLDIVGDPAIAGGIVADSDEE